MGKKFTKEHVLLEGYREGRNAVAKQPACILHLEILTASGTWASGISLCDSDVALLMPLASFFSFAPKVQDSALSIDLFASSCPC